MEVLVKNAAVEQFMVAIESDASLKRDFATCSNTHEIIKLASEHKYLFTENDYNAYVEELSNAYDDLPSTVTMSGLVRCPSSWPT